MKTRSRRASNRRAPAIRLRLAPKEPREATNGHGQGAKRARLVVDGQVVLVDSGTPARPWIGRATIDDAASGTVRVRWWMRPEDCEVQGDAPAALPGELYWSTQVQDVDRDSILQVLAHGVPRSTRRPSGEGWWWRFMFDVEAGTLYAPLEGPRLGFANRAGAAAVRPERAADPAPQWSAGLSAESTAKLLENWLVQLYGIVPGAAEGGAKTPFEHFTALWMRGVFVGRPEDQRATLAAVHRRWPLERKATPQKSMCAFCGRTEALVWTPPAGCPVSVEGRWFSTPCHEVIERLAALQELLEAPASDALGLNPRRHLYYHRDRLRTHVLDVAQAWDAVANVMR